MKEPHALASRIMDGEKLSSIKDAQGEKMTDRYLVSTFADSFPWLPKVYDETSGYVHLSEKHYWNAMGPTNEEGMIEMHVGAEDMYVTDEYRSEVILACQEITEGLFDRFSAWAKTKDLKAHK